MDSNQNKENIKKSNEIINEACFSEDRLLLHLSLARITFLSFYEKKYFEKNLDSSQSLALLSIEDIQKQIHRNLSAKCKWNGPENLRMAKAALVNCRRLNVKIILNDDECYPELLRQIADPPYLLFCRGNVSLLAEKNARNVSVVGTRRLSAEGKKAARNFAYDAVLDGCNIVSGLAYGADGCAHKGALEAFYDVSEKGGDVSVIGRTIAVMPSAIDEIVPYMHKTLAVKILESGGCLLSEYEPGMPVVKWHFVGRNRIIAGLSAATVVIEAPAGSGSLITADFAVEYDRELMFHSAVFGKTAKAVSDAVFDDLKKGYQDGTVSKYKVENRPEKFLDAGASVINDYADFCRVLSEAPEERKRPVQGELFSFSEN